MREHQDAAEERGEALEVVRLTERAAVKVQELLSAAAEDNGGALRVAVQAGGCAGFRYALLFDDRSIEGDVESIQHDVKVRVDGRSAAHLSGATVDWKESLQSSGFSIDNPKASGGCACGESSAF